MSSDISEGWLYGRYYVLPCSVGESVCLLGVSQGGLIILFLTIDFSDASMMFIVFFFAILSKIYLEPFSRFA